MNRSIFSFGLAAVVAATLLGSAPASAADFKPTIRATPAVVVVAPGKIGSTTLAYDAGKKHPYVEVWVSVNGSNLKKLLEDDGDGKGTRTVSVTSSVAGTKYRYVLTDFGKVLASVDVVVKTASSPPPVVTPTPTPTPGNPTPPVATPPTPGTPPPAPTPGAETNLEGKYATEALIQINAFRKENGLPPVNVTFKLSQAAWKYAGVMASKDQMGHSVDGTTVQQRLAAVGYSYARYFENVATNKGYANPGAEAVKSWRESTSGHREAMLNREVTELGIGAAKSSTGNWYFCLVLGKPR